MTNQQKALEHLAKAERWQREAEKLEQAADSRGSNSYIAGVILKDDPEYKQAVGNRNAHQTQATMYGIIAIMEKLHEGPAGTMYPRGTTPPGFSQ